MGTLEKRCCFTGHRYHHFRFGRNEDHPECKKVKDFLHASIEHLYREHGVTYFISGGAVGVDLWAAEAVMHLREEHPEITLEIALPFSGMWDKFKEEDRLRYERLKDMLVTVVCSEYTPRCFHDRNRYMVDNSAFLIAVWNGGASGSGMTVEYAQGRGRNIVSMNPEAAAPDQSRVFFEVVSNGDRQYGSCDMTMAELRQLAASLREYRVIGEHVAGAIGHSARVTGLMKLLDMFETAGIGRN